MVGLLCNKFKGGNDKVMLVIAIRVKERGCKLVIGGNNASGQEQRINVINDKVKVTWLGNALNQRGLGMVHGLRKRQYWLKHNQYAVSSKEDTPYLARKIRRIYACTHQRPQRNKDQYAVSRGTQYAVLKIWNQYNILENIKGGPYFKKSPIRRIQLLDTPMDNPNLTMEEYMRLEEEKARKRGKVFNWKTATYGKNQWDDEVYYDLETIGMPELLRDGLFVRMVMEHHDEAGRRWIPSVLLRYWSESERMIPGKGDLHDYWRDISTDGDFLGPPPSYTLIRDSIMRLCHRMMAHSIAGRSHAPEKAWCQRTREGSSDAKQPQPTNRHQLLLGLCPKDWEDLRRRCKDYLMDSSGQPYQAFDGTFRGSSPVTFHRRVR
ncbi:hypothetical protein Tco_0533010 [Tanacetum coccineum]